MGEEEKKQEGAEAKKPEAEKKPEEKKEEEKKPEEKKEEKKTEESKDPPPPPPDEIVLKVYMHCEGCARKVKRCLKTFQGVEDVQTDCKTHKVIVKGKSADPLKVCERVQKKSHRKVELLSPIPKPPTEEEKKVAEEKKAAEEAKPEEKKEEPKVITVVLKVHMHCEACALEIQKRIMRMKGVQSAEPDLKGSQVTVKGVFDPEKLVEYVYKRTGKHAAIVKTEPEKKEEEKGKEEKDEKKEEKEKAGEEEKKEKKEGDGEEGKQGNEEATKLELLRNEFYYYPPKSAMEYAYAYPPQIFSDENPNACSIM
ncbi:hypothetical protein IFM89_029287 [Coptis chinensis]|uniref:HMA domain-containing protein n=1 Tax=Coptis chinensis TaxID=261450 RepID=A0A835HTT1_9MAGN|nr:hypothetical protein IFM89_029287 [Coptis chinensis]